MGYKEGQKQSRWEKGGKKEGGRDGGCRHVGKGWLQVRWGLLTGRHRWGRTIPEGKGRLGCCCRWE